MDLYKFTTEYMPKLPIEDYLVRLKLKYNHEDSYRYTNQLLLVDMNIDNYYYWQNDWCEGETDIEVIGCIAISDIEVPSLE